MKVSIISTENFKVDGGAMYGVIPKSMWSKVYPADEKNMCNLANRCLFIETDNRRILVDTGIGDKHNAKFLSHIYVNGDGNLYKSLANAGLSTNDITDVVFTHLHWDHCAGATHYNADKTSIELTFPRAMHWVSKTQWEWANNKNAREKAAFQDENLIPLKESGMLRFIESDGWLFPDIEVRIFNGHTMGMISLIIHGKNNTLAVPCDLIPSFTHIPLTWIAAYDIQPLVLLNEKTAFLQEAVQNNWILFFEHDINVECCTLQQTSKGIEAKEIIPLSSVRL